MTLGFSEIATFTGLSIQVALYIRSKLTQKKLRCQLVLAIQQPIDDVLDSGYRVTETTMTIFGAYWLGHYVDLPEERAVMLCEQYMSDYELFVERCRTLSETITYYDSEFMDIFGDEWIYLKTMMRIFDGDKPEWEQFISNPLLNQYRQQHKRQNEFVNALNREINGVNNEINVDSTELNAIANLLTNKDYLKCIRKCMDNHKKPQYQIHKPHR